MQVKGEVFQKRSIWLPDTDIQGWRLEIRSAWEPLLKMSIFRFPNRWFCLGETLSQPLVNSSPSGGRGLAVALLFFTPSKATIYSFSLSLSLSLSSLFALTRRSSRRHAASLCPRGFPLFWGEYSHSEIIALSQSLEKKKT